MNYHSLCIKPPSPSGRHRTKCLETFSSSRYETKYKYLARGKAKEAKWKKPGLKNFRNMRVIVCDFEQYQHQDLVPGKILLYKKIPSYNHQPDELNRQFQDRYFVRYIAEILTIPKIPITHRATGTTLRHCLAWSCVHHQSLRHISGT